MPLRPADKRLAAGGSGCRPFSGHLAQELVDVAIAAGHVVQARVDARDAQAQPSDDVRVFAQRTSNRPGMSATAAGPIVPIVMMDVPM
jgi:hypothetical protein